MIGGFIRDYKSAQRALARIEAGGCFDPVEGEDDSNPSRGIIIGLAFSAALWAGLIWLALHFLTGSA